MATTGHESEAINVAGLKASLQKLKTDHIDGKADEATTLAGYGITDAYTKTEVNGLVDTPHQNYVTVAATSQTTAATDVLPASGQAADTIYRVSNWDGSANSGAGAFDATCYSEYAWDDVSNPNKYVFLDVKSQIGEVFDISVYNNNAKYADLAAALNGGANIPQSLQKGGMSVKYVSSSDNNYVQFRCKLQSFSINPEDWYFDGDNTLIDNPEFIDIKTDSEDKILEDITREGRKEINIPTTFKDDVTILGTIISDTLNNAINSKVDKVEGKELSTNDYTDADKELVATHEIVDNPEYIKVEVDSEDKILAGRTPDGAAFENVGFFTPKVSIDGHIIEDIEDPEGRSEITTDSEGKVISWRKPDGTKVENKGVETNSLVISEEGMTDFIKAIKNSSTIGINDVSDKNAIELPEPKNYGLLNLIISNLPTSSSIKGKAQYYDFTGNTFELECKVSPQGQSSKFFAETGGKGNYTLDLSKDVKFGSWVPQDSFHLKGCAKDVTRGYLPTSYKWAYKMLEYLDANPSRVLVNESNITVNSATGDRTNDWPNEARCLPDGFPCELYINGEYWGLYSLQLKKHRKNYLMDKKDYTSFFLDAEDFGTNFWVGEIPWTKFEIKNPKDLVCMDGSAYDGDNPQELIDETAVGIYDNTNKKHKGSKQTKELIKSFPTKYIEVKALIDNEDIDGAKAKFNEYFDYNACMLVYIFNCLMANQDSLRKNTLWGVYKGGKIAPMLWDLDSIYGEEWVGIKAYSPSAYMWEDTYATFKWPLSLLWNLYEDEIKAAYARLRTDKVISMESWRDVVYTKWVNRIGKEAYERDLARWPETPSYRKNYTNTEYWYENAFLMDSQGYPIWNELDSYNVGDIVVLKMSGDSNYVSYQCKVANTGVCPVTKFYDSFPELGGFYDSPKRMEKWMIEQIRLCDAVLGYTENI